MRPRHFATDYQDHLHGRFDEYRECPTPRKQRSINVNSAIIARARARVPQLCQLAFQPQHRLPLSHAHSCIRASALARGRSLCQFVFSEIRFDGYARATRARWMFRSAERISSLASIIYASGGRISHGPCRERLFIYGRHKY